VKSPGGSGSVSPVREAAAHELVSEGTDAERGTASGLTEGEVSAALRTSVEMWGARRYGRLVDLRRT